MNMLSIRRNAALVSVTLNLSLFICLLAISTKVPIRVTLTRLSITVEINPDKSPSCFNFLQDVTEILIASDEEGKTARDSSHSTPTSCIGVKKSSTLSTQEPVFGKTYAVLNSAQPY